MTPEEPWETVRDLVKQTVTLQFEMAPLKKPDSTGFYGLSVLLGISEAEGTTGLSAASRLTGRK